MNDLYGTLRYCYESYTGNWGSDTYQGSSISLTNSFRSMVIPLSGNIVTVPSFALYAFSRFFDTSSKDAIVVNLNHNNTSASFKSLDPAMRNMLKTDYSNKRLIKFPFLSKCPKPYYGTFGAIFDEDFNPVMMTMWKLEKLHKEEGKRLMYVPIKPLLWVSPKIFIEKSDTIQRYIVNKIIPAALSLSRVYAPVKGSCLTRNGHNDAMTVSLVSESCPFLFRSAHTPSISTSNKNLLDVALNNMDELMQ